MYKVLDHELYKTTNAINVIRAIKATRALKAVVIEVSKPIKIQKLPHSSYI